MTSIQPRRIEIGDPVPLVDEYWEYSQRVRLWEPGIYVDVLIGVHDDSSYGGVYDPIRVKIKAKNNRGRYITYELDKEGIGTLLYGEQLPPKPSWAYGYK